jgi:diacylglycerol O-acyltransferase / wax synthase
VTVTRLTALDASFLEAETATAHMHVGWAALFDPREGGPRPTFDELLAHIASRMARAPRYRQKLAEVPLGAADPLWVDDTNFRIERHVRRSQRDDLSGLIDDVMSRRLRRDRPLWELWIADELADGRLGIVGKAHHCMVDGLAAVELATLLLDPEPEPAAPPRDAWRPAPPPGPLGLLAGGIAARAQGAMEAATAPARHLARNPGEITRAPELAAKAGRALVDSVRPGAGGSRFTGQGSPLRHLATATRPLDDLRAIAHGTGTSVNDVLLAATAGGVRQFELERGGEPRPLKTMVPVSVRASDGSDELGNRIAFMFIDIPCDEPAPRRRLEMVASEMGTRKDNGNPEGADLMLRLLGYTPRTVQHFLSRLVSSPRAFDLVVSNIPGPRPPLWMLGCELREAYPVVPMADSHAVSIGLTTVRDDVFLGVYADRKALPDADRLADLIDGAFEQMKELVAEPVLA